MQLCHRIRQARLDAKLSQTQLALKTGVQRSAVAQWERDGGTRPTVDRLADIAIVTNVNFEWLATGRGDRRGPVTELASNDPDHGGALLLEVYAQCELEERALRAFRQLKIDVQMAQVDFLETLAGRGKGGSKAGGGFDASA